MQRSISITKRFVHSLRELLARSEEHTSELQSQSNLVCRLLLEKINGQRANGIARTTFVLLREGQRERVVVKVKPEDQAVAVLVDLHSCSRCQGAPAASHPRNFA